MLIAELAEVNTLLSRYILRLLDVDAGRAEPVHVDDERALVERVVRVADSVRARAERRERDGAQLPFKVINAKTDGGERTGD
ncbi:MAG TPA: hypothetical protein VGP26_04580 [Actinophytocola sp.]|nr:hypothetical protein [Actinophytocola sp.]